MSAGNASFATSLALLRWRAFMVQTGRFPMERSMYRHHHWADDEAERKAAERQTASLASIVIVLFLLAGGLFLVQHLRVVAAIEDCLMSGRRNCDALVVGRH
jgi:hypothetical protein